MAAAEPAMFRRRNDGDALIERSGDAVNDERDRAAAIEHDSRIQSLGISEPARGDFTSNINGPYSISGKTSKICLQIYEWPSAVLPSSSQLLWPLASALPSRATPRSCPPKAQLRRSKRSLATLRCSRRRRHSTSVTAAARASSSSTTASRNASSAIHHRDLAKLPPCTAKTTAKVAHHTLLAEEGEQRGASPLLPTEPSTPPPSSAKLHAERPFRHSHEPPPSSKVVTGCLLVVEELLPCCCVVEPPPPEFITKIAVWSVRLESMKRRDKGDGVDRCYRRSSWL
nr:hypothetical protein Iba_chr10eCG8810 [Ipomoea batatas]